MIWLSWNSNPITAQKKGNETARARHNKEKGDFEKREFILINLTWNVHSKQTKINEAVVKIILLRKLQHSNSLYTVFPLISAPGPRRLLNFETVKSGAN